MSVRAPHFLLYSQATPSALAAIEGESGRWRFVLESADGTPALEAEDEEPETSAERLKLLAIVRGLEALEQPSRVTLVSPGPTISRGIRYGLAQWRENGWQWERYGQLSPVKNCDLWQRIERATAIHEIVCRERTATADDLDESRREITSEPRVIQRQHRGRQLRIDIPGGGIPGGAAEQRPGNAANRPRRAVPPPPPGLVGWLLAALRLAASLVANSLAKSELR
jgi:ribonuclease HI